MPRESASQTEASELANVFHGGLATGGGDCAPQRHCHGAAKALIAAQQNPRRAVEVFTGPGTATLDGKCLRGQHVRPGALDGAVDPGSLPEDRESDHVQTNVAPRAL